MKKQDHDFGARRSGGRSWLCSDCKKEKKEQTFVERVEIRHQDRTLWQILVPAQDIHGNPIAVGHHKEWDERCREITGDGMTIMSTAKGDWVNGSLSEVMREPMIPVMLLATATQMDEIAKFTAFHYDQKAVFFYTLSYDAYLAERIDDEKTND
jgi:hypothetical protein